LQAAGYLVDDRMGGASPNYLHSNAWRNGLNRYLVMSQG
jgi:hypothetical protein